MTVEWMQKLRHNHTRGYENEQTIAIHLPLMNLKKKNLFGTAYNSRPAAALKLK